MVLDNHNVSKIDREYESSWPETKMDAELINLLQNTKTVDNQSQTSFLGRSQHNYTHVSYWGPHQRWNIKSGKMAIFWEKYCELVFQKPKGGYSLAEKPAETMPLMVEGTLKFQIDDQPVIHEAYATDFILAVIACYQQAIEDVLILSDNCGEMICCAVESDLMWEEQGHMLHKFRLQFPYCKTDVNIQNKLIRPRAIQLLRSNNVVSRLPQQPVNDWDNILDSNFVLEPIVLYGSTTNANHPKMSLTYIVGLVTDDHVNTATPPELELSQIFHVNNHSHILQNIVDPLNLSQDKPLEFWIPMLLSIHYWMAITLPKDQAPTIKSLSSPLVLTTRTTRTTTSREEESELELAERFIQMLSRERLEDYGSWLDVGRALYSISKGNDEGLNIWIRWTEQSDTRNYEDCSDLYPTFRDTPITIKTLGWFARKDSPDQYLAWHKSWCQPVMEKAVSCLHTDVARALYRVYWLEFACSSVTKSTWYFFNDHRWSLLDNGIVLRKAISHDFLNRFECIQSDIAAQLQQVDDDGIKDSGNNLIKKICTLSSKLRNVTFKNMLMREAMEFFNNGRFDSVLDSNQYLLGLTNGVIEICGNKAVFREGKPEDFISKCTGVPYREDLSWDNRNVKALMAWLRKVFPDPDLERHFYKLAASGLQGRNSHKLFPIWTGDGDNSKSMVVKLFEATYGSYCIKFPTALLTGKRTQSSAPMPEVARSKATRWAFLQEPDDEEEIKGGLLKELTGGDSFFARMLHDNGGEVQSFFKLVLMCNKPPSVPSGGKAVKNRLRIIPFLSKWIDNPPQDEEEQVRQRLFKKDPQFEDSIPRFAPAFLWLMVQYFPILKEEGLEDPPIVNEATKEYWEQTDMYTQFTNECIQQALKPDGTRDPSAKMTLSEVYDEFKHWFRSSYPGDKVPQRTLVRGELEQRWGKLTRSSWYGIRTLEHMANI
jgi:phage/plasmid-associated DNA primase